MSNAIEVQHFMYLNVHKGIIKILEKKLKFNILCI